jgi:hypothetical protein
MEPESSMRIAVAMGWVSAGSTACDSWDTVTVEGVETVVVMSQESVR